MHNAEDILQETFAELLQSHQLLFGIKEPRTFLTTTAKNILINRIKKEQFEASYLSELQKVHQLLGSQRR